MDLRSQLQQHLGTAYTLERELGGGGMSQVFLATEVRLGRKVVIKVLSPDLAQGMNAERFEREIRLAASLQQANIVPLLVAGEVGGIPYFTMPFVEGESLRHRLGQGPLPVSEVLDILRDVSRALAYAHARGVVHRDIKPDNVLLSGGAAVVTDFGIAKAIDASRTDAGGGTLTQLGTSLGTPAYMAPEQVAGDPDLDHRVDLYALGCLAYELLTGQVPFPNRSPQRMLAAHLSESPMSPTALRPDTPPVLVDLVSQLMQKDPSHRPQTATEVLQRIDGVTTSAPSLAFSSPAMLRRSLILYAIATGVVLLCTKAANIAIGLPDWVFPGAIVVMGLGLPALLVTAYVQRVARHAATTTPTLTPGGTKTAKVPTGAMATMAMRASPHVTWRRAWRGGMYAVGGFATLIVLFMVSRNTGIGPWGSLMASGKLAADDRIVLADLAASPEDSALAPIVVEAVRAALSQSRTVRLVPPTEIASALDEMKRPRETRLAEPALVNEVAQRTNAKGVLGGRLARVGTGYAVSLELRSASAGTVLASYQATADGAKDLLNVVDGLTRKLRGRVGESLKHVQQSVPLQRATTISLVALRKYTEAAFLNDVQHDYDRAVQVAREAVALDSTFALAWRKLGVAMNNAGYSAAQVDSVIANAAKFADRLPPLERALVLGAHYARSDRGKSYAAYREAYGIDSTNTVALNELGRIFDSRRQFDSSEQYTRLQFAQDPNTANAIKVVRALYRKGDTTSAKAMLDSLAQHTPGARSIASLVLAQYYLQVSLGHRDSARIAAEALRESRAIPAKVLGLDGLAALDVLEGRLNSALALRDESFRLTASRDSASQFTGLDEAAFEIMYRSHSSEGVKHLDALVGSAKWRAADPDTRPYPPLIELYAEAGRPDRARAMLSQYMASAPTAKETNAQPRLAALRADIALAEGNTAEALKEFRASAVGADGAQVVSAAEVEYQLARAFDRAGQPDSTLAHLEKYLAVPPGQRPSPDAQHLALVERRLGELYDAKKDKEKALLHYGAFVDLWKNADADLQVTVKSVRARMGELVRAGG